MSERGDDHLNELAVGVDPGGEGEGLGRIDNCEDERGGELHG